MAEPLITEGVAEYHVPGLSAPSKTWYKIVGNLREASTQAPLIILHGGPGCSHNYLLPFADLAKRYSVPCIFYDQIGNGNSTHLRERNGDREFWTVELFRKELDNLIDHLDLRTGNGFDILGHSWGGMLGSAYATTRPKGLRRLVIANSPASMELWVEGIVKLLDKLPPGVAKTIRDCEEKKDFESKAYTDAIDIVYKKHLCRIEPWPPEVHSALEALTGDPTVYGTMNGPSEITITGTLRGWTVIDQLHKIEVPTLAFHGSEDEAQDVAVEPFFWHIPKAKWTTFQDASHFSHLEKREQVMKLVGDFLIGK